ncbi:tetratricopeptide repeat protein [Hymenobacter aquaticus]|uniref:Tetratricopeptide repeat protein n=1 Tax=Hymenobacter aquaticus TaxID=1867101 RepID=A0A4Z0PVN3_9BACT|nr:sensor histidine kinase [Hymenobacter aquaticus]TGE21369.1 tetratricopeptide repeat protein [Hymenobacter aquaticus]
MHNWLTMLASALGLLLLGWLGAPLRAEAQHRALDSLKTLVRTAPADTTRAQAAYALVPRYVTSDTVQAWSYARQGLALAHRSGDKATVAAAHLVLGNLYDYAGRHALARRHFHQARAIYQQLYRTTRSGRALKSLAATYVNLSNICSRENDYQQATGFLLRAARYLVQAGDSDLLVTTYHNLAGQFFELNQMDKALRYATFSARIAAARPDLEARFSSYLATASILLQLRHYPETRQYLEQARVLLPQMATSSYLYSYYQNTADYHLAQHNYPAAATNLRQAIALVQQRNELSALADLYLSLGTVRLATRRYDEAERLFRQSAAIFERLQAPASRARALEQLAQTEERRGHPAQALAYYKQYQQLSHSVAEEETQRQINVLENQYRTQQKEQQIVSLRRQRQFQAAELSRKNLLLLACSGLLLAVLVAGVLGYLNLRNRQLLARQAQLLQERQLLDLRNEYRLSVANAVLQGQEEERRRLARDLHDGLGGMLSTIKLYLLSVQTDAGLSARNNGLFATALDHLDSSVTELRRVAHNLMPEVLLQFGLAVALQEFCNRVHQARQLQVRCQLLGLEKPLPQPVELAVYRIVQELVNNVIKHARATEVLVQFIRQDDQANLVVEDDGQGLPRAACPEGAGLKGIRARVEYLNGGCEIQAVPGQGTSVFITFPIDATG